MAIPTTLQCGVCDQLLDQLARSAWHPGLLTTMLPALSVALQPASAVARLRWGQALDAVWARASDERDAGKAAFELGLLAGYMQRWKQACFFFVAALERGWEDALVWVNLGQAQWQLAQHGQAEASYIAAAMARPDTLFIVRQLSALRDWRKTCMAQLDAECVVGDGAGSGIDAELIATPLGPHHALPLLRLQGDRTVADGARIARLTSERDAHAWIDAANAGNRMTLAVIQPDYGLIGVISLDRYRDAATFYYWIGVQFQCKGYGTLAIGLLKTLARQRGIRALFSAVYTDNHASRTVLQRNGFRPLGVAVLPAQPLDYFAWAYPCESTGPAVTQQLCTLQALLAGTGSSRKLAMPSVARPVVC